MEYAVLYHDRHVDNQMEFFETIEESIQEVEEWIGSLGYKPCEWSKSTKAKNNDDLEADIAWYHPCEEDKAEIFKIK